MSAEQIKNEQPAEGNTDAPVKKRGNGRSGKIALAVLLIVGIVSGSALWIKSKANITTDNAFIEAHVYPVSARVPGHVARVLVKDNQLVRKGDVLLELDPTDYDIQLKQAAASLNVTRNETSGDYARLEESKAAAANARARLEQADLDLKRGKNLFDREVLPKEQVDRLLTARKIAESQLKEAEESVRRAAAQVGLSVPGAREAKVAQKAAQLKEAAQNLNYTKIVAPTDGYVTRKSVEPGSNIQPGQPLLALVSLDAPWVVANFKERQLSHVSPGQKVVFEVDAYPGRRFTGKVDSVMAGTGAAFSLLPPENATGNYVKVVQRIPVKIAIDEKSDAGRILRVGMSVVPTIITGRAFGEILGDLNPFN